MRAGTWFALIALASASALSPREVQTAEVQQEDPEIWRPLTGKPQFFSLKVDDKCKEGETADQCEFDGYAIRLTDGIVIATPYNKWWDPPLPMFFVDDDSKTYTVRCSKTHGAIDSRGDWLIRIAGQQEAA